jgi:hypothetical protein
MSVRLARSNSTHHIWWPLEAPPQTENEPDRFLHFCEKRPLRLETLGHRRPLTGSVEALTGRRQDGLNQTVSGYQRQR